MGRPGDMGRNMGNDKNTEMGKQARKIETKNSRQRKIWRGKERSLGNRTSGRGKEGDLRSGSGVWYLREVRRESGGLEV